jgi:hypothetical protein
MTKAHTSLYRLVLCDTGDTWQTLTESHLVVQSPTGSSGRQAQPCMALVQSNSPSKSWQPPAKLQTKSL